MEEALGPPPLLVAREGPNAAPLGGRRPAPRRGAHPREHARVRQLVQEGLEGP